MITYVDASVLLRRALRQKDSLEWSRLEETVSSSLIRVECLRTVDRLRLEGRIDENALVELRESLLAMLQTCSLIELGPPILELAAMTFPVSIKSLDAIHLASAMTYREVEEQPIRIATHDRALARAGRAMGFEVLGAS